MPASTLNRRQELRFFDDRKTRRFVVGRVADEPRAFEPSDEEYNPQRYREFARAAETATSDMYAELGLA